MQPFIAYLYSIMSERAIARLTGVPRITLYRFKTGISVPSSKQLSALTRGYKSSQYQYLRSAGFPIHEARAWKGKTPAEINKGVIRITRMAEKISRTSKVSLENIMRGISHSYKDIDIMEKESP